MEKGIIIIMRLIIILEIIKTQKMNWKAKNKIKTVFKFINCI